MTAPTPRGSYPHPVLDASDDVASYLEVSNAAVSPSAEDIGLSFDLRFNDPTLKTLLDEGKARLSLRWRCSATLSTGEAEPDLRAPLADGNQYEFWIDQRQVTGTVIADIRVVAMDPLAGFKWERQHADYGGTTFDLRVGDVLADGGAITFAADKLFDPLDPPIGSCFKFVADPTRRKGVRVTFEEDDAILVRMPPEAHGNLALLGPRPELQLGTVVMPALMQAISLIQNVQREQSEDLSDRIWFQTISNVVDRIGGFDLDAIELAQKILEFPLDRILAIEADTEEEAE